MYKLVIADDEPKIRRGLRKALEWNKFGIEVAGEAEDGEEAFEIAKKIKPDIIFLDICMPFLNGLDLVEKLKSDNESCLIIIITGFDEFNYMQKAIKLKVFDYLLKPVRKSNLKSAVERAVNELEKTRNKRNYFDWADKEVKQNMDLVRENFFKKLTKGEIQKDRILPELKFMNINFKNKIGMMVIRIFKKSEIETSKVPDNNLVKFAIVNIAEETIKKNEEHIFFSDENENIVMISEIANVNEWTRLGPKLAQNVEKYLNIMILTEAKEYSDIQNSDKVYTDIVNKINKRSEYKPITILILRYIENKYFENDLSLEKTAKQFNITSSYLSKLLKNETGYSFIDHLTNLRIEKAICIMKDPTVKICEVAELVGYSDQQYFSRAFKRVKGVSPIQFKEGVRNFEKKT